MSAPQKHRCRLKPEKWTALVDAFRQGMSLSAAADHAKVSFTTAKKAYLEGYADRAPIKDQIASEQVSARALLVEAREKELNEREQALRAEEIRRERARAEFDLVHERARAGKLVQSAQNCVVQAYALQAKWASSKIVQRLGELVAQGINSEIANGAIDWRQGMRILRQLQVLTSETIIQGGNTIRQYKEIMGEMEVVANHTGELPSRGSLDVEEVLEDLQGDFDVEAAIQTLADHDTENPLYKVLMELDPTAVEAH